MGSDSKTELSGRSATETSPSENGLLLSRRTLGKGAAVLLGGGGAGLGYLWFGSRPALAVDNADEWIANSAEITTHDGSVDSITFGDPDGITDADQLEADDDRLVLEWSGLSSGTREVDFTVYLAGTDGGDGGEWANGQETTDEESLATGAETISGTNGSDAFTWNDVFGESQPVDVADHSEIELSDFEAPTDGQTRVRELSVTVEVVVPDEDDLTATATTTATITVTNQGAAIEVGGQGSFEIESDEEV